MRGRLAAAWRFVVHLKRPAPHRFPVERVREIMKAVLESKLLNEDGSPVPYSAEYTKELAEQIRDELRGPFASETPRRCRSRMRPSLLSHRLEAAPVQDHGAGGGWPAAWRGCAHGLQVPLGLHHRQQGIRDACECAKLPRCRFPTPPARAAAHRLALAHTGQPLCSGHCIRRVLVLIFPCRVARNALSHRHLRSPPLLRCRWPCHAAAAAPRQSTP